MKINVVLFTELYRDLVTTGRNNLETLCNSRCVCFCVYIQGSDLVSVEQALNLPTDPVGLLQHRLLY